MRLIEILALDNGAHRNFNADMEVPVPEGWAVIPEEMENPDTFPFVNIEAKEVDGVMTVTSMTAGVMPEPEPKPEPEPQPEPGTSVWDELDAAYREGVDSV
jgi:hypothetical protein